VATEPSDTPNLSNAHRSLTSMSADDFNGYQTWSSYCPIALQSESRYGSNDCQFLLQDYTPPTSANLTYMQSELTFRENFNLAYLDVPESSCLRASNASPHQTTPVESISESYHPPEAYMLEPQKSQEIADIQDQAVNGQLLQMQLGDDHESSCETKVKEEYGHNLPGLIGSNISMRCATPHDGPYKSEMDARDNGSCKDGTIEKDQPYAQLIYRALLEVPGHTMILRDIYAWFKDNTDKAHDKETKGWQNSIRHNLSMNGVSTSGTNDIPVLTAAGFPES
jgi:hypothetical protein